MTRFRRLVDRIARGVTPTRTDTILALFLVFVQSMEVLATVRGHQHHPGEERPLPWFLPVAASMIAPVAVAWRRRSPLRAVVISSAAVIAASLVGLAIHGQSLANRPLDTAGLSFVFLAYSAVRYGTGSRRTQGWGIALASIYVAELCSQQGIPWGTFVSNAIGWTAIAGLAMAFGYRATLRAEREDQARVGEREQLARELHDVVAHHVSAMVVQASAALAVLDTQPEAARPALQFIKTSGQETMGEMRQMVGILRGAEAAELAPRRGIAGLPDLLADVPGQLPVRLQVTGTPRPVDVSVDQSVHRIVQEGVTNARRHGRGATRIDVTLAWSDDHIDASISNDGAAVADISPAETGFGLVGMAERARLLGGTFAAGPRASGGWAVSACLPFAGQIADAVAAPSPEPMPVPHQPEDRT